MTHQPREGRAVTARPVVRVSELAARMDKRMYAEGLTEAQLRDGCVVAVRQGVGAVLTVPERLEVAAEVLQGSPVGLASALGWYQPDSARLDAQAMADEAQDMVKRGATEVAYTITKGRLAHDDGREVASHVARMVDAIAPLGARPRVILATEQLSEHEITRTCHDVTRAGAWMVQGGSWRGDRAALSQIELIRAALPPEVLVKWTAPVRTVSTMLLCISMGVDRFNGDVDQILGDAARAEWLGPLTLPVAGVDY